jgi:hypothetical protein
VIGVSEDTGQEGGRGVGKARTIREKWLPIAEGVSRTQGREEGREAQERLEAELGSQRFCDSGIMTFIVRHVTVRWSRSWGRPHCQRLGDLGVL